jgi:hypothetical protein
MDLDGDGDADMNDYAYVVDLYPDVAIYSMNGFLFSVKYKIAKNDVTLGAPVRVDVCYAPVKESGRVPVTSSRKLSEGAYNKSTGKLTVTVIQPGFNTSQSKYYKESALKRGHKVFEGAKMFANHQTALEEKARPEGDVNHWVANLKSTWVESDGSIKGDVVVIDPTFKAKLENLAEAGLLGEMGVSIRAIGEGYNDTVEGVETMVVESFIAARSVDFVTYPGAGGRVETIESDSNDPNDVDLVTLAELSKRRPDLVLLIESKTKKELDNMKTAEQLNTELAEANKKIETLTTEAQEAVKTGKKAVAAAELTKLLSESKLPAPAQVRLKEQFKEAVEVAGMKEAIEAEKTYIASLTGNKGGVRNMGASEADLSEADAGDKDDAADKISMVESYQKMGLSKEEAEIAAKGHR